ncbi:MAG: Eco57I restriction-modification methylase domain-containing protein [Bacteroidaceae bacterium]|nr:Eco57I restriction-modification methylase domain-containing protein [Bacteroidaceae bacterium]
MRTDTYNPDVLNCLANLSNDEVFTPPALANQVLDMLPQELFTSSTTTFLDPVSKSGVFLREIVKRLDRGLEPQMPDRRQRIDHILHRQVFGIAITELTAHLSRRSVYCSKDASSEYSVTRFKSESGNILYRPLHHTWANGKCRYCGASQEVYDRGDQAEQYAYQFIHTDNPHTLFNNMKFDVIIGNPPYQLETGGAGKQAKPIYDLFVSQAMKLNPRFLTMIVPSRWFSGGMKQLEDFREKMMNDGRIRVLVDYANAKECFPQNSISGGVCYFLWDRDHKGDCRFTNIKAGKEEVLNRPLNEFPVLVRYNNAVSILHKTKTLNEESLSKIVSSLCPYGLPTNYRGKERSFDGALILHSSEGESYIHRKEILKGMDCIDTYKIIIGKVSAEHAGEPGKDGMYRVLTASTRVIGPKEVCTHSYFIIGNYKHKECADNLLGYLYTKFVRFLLLVTMSSINLSKFVFWVVPLQDFSHPWTDEMLYKKYGLTDDEIAFIESMIRPME